LQHDHEKQPPERAVKVFIFGQKHACLPFLINIDLIVAYPSGFVKRRTTVRNEKFAKRLGATRHAYQTATARACVTGEVLCYIHSLPAASAAGNRGGQADAVLRSG
jgi:hypothetical protein